MFPNPLQASRCAHLRIAATFLVLLAAAGCEGEAPRAPARAPAELEADQAGYLRPPRVLQSREIAGRVRLEGVGPARARIRVAEAGGRSAVAASDASGRWSLELPVSAAPRAFLVSAEQGRRTVQAEGPLLDLPGTVDLVLRAGHGALPLADGPRPRIISLDLGADGAAAVSGVARAGAAVVTRVDGAPSGETPGLGQGTADAQGRFAVILDRPLQAGAHVVEVNTPDGVARVQVEATPVATLGQRSLAVARGAAGWRVDWRTPGGGVQTTIVFEEPGG